MLRLFLSILAAIALASCSAGGLLLDASTTTMDVATADKAAKSARLTYVGLLNLANVYAARPRCGQPTSPVLCSEQEVVNALRKADTAADAATSALENGVRSLGSSPTVLAALAKGADASLSAWRQIVATYRVN